MNSLKNLAFQIPRVGKITFKKTIKTDHECHETILDAIYERHHLIFKDRQFKRIIIN